MLEEVADLNEYYMQHLRCDGIIDSKRNVSRYHAEDLFCFGLVQLTRLHWKSLVYGRNHVRYGFSVEDCLV